MESYTVGDALDWLTHGLDRVSARTVISISGHNRRRAEELSTVCPPSGDILAHTLSWTVPHDAPRIFLDARPSAVIVSCGYCRHAMAASVRSVPPGPQSQPWELQQKPACG
jgi:hypothetical protein